MNPLYQDKPASQKEASIIQNQLTRVLRDGLAAAEIPTGRLRHGMIYIDALPSPMAVTLRPYTLEVPVWRITFGSRLHDTLTCIINPHELTFHEEEFCLQTGIDLARLLRDPGWQWPLFEGDSSYPTYAWTQLAAVTYKSFREGREGHRVSQKFQPGQQMKDQEPDNEPDWAEIRAFYESSEDSLRQVAEKFGVARGFPKCLLNRFFATFSG